VKLFLIPLLFCSLLFGDSLHFTQDKKKHLGISFALGNATALYMQYNYPHNSYAKNLLISTSLATIPGIVKELSDSQKNNNHFSSADLTYDILGSFLGAITGVTIGKKIFVNIKEKKIAYNMTF